LNTNLQFFNFNSVLLSSCW